MRALKPVVAVPGHERPAAARQSAELHPLPGARAPAAPQPAKRVPPGERARRAVRKNAPSAALWAISLLGLLAFWYFATQYRWQFYVRFTNIPTPAEVLQRLMEVNQSPKFMTNIGISVRRILSGFTLAAAAGIPLGLLIGRYRPVRDLLMPMSEVLRPIPAIAWVPMSIMLWPNNEASIVFITFLGSFFPILLNTIHGVNAIDPVLIRAARCLGASEPALLWNVVLPAALPQVFTGLSVGMGVAWVSLIAAEMISGQFGVGYFTWEAYSLVNYAEIVLGMITIGVLGLACSGLVRGLGSVAMPWQGAASTGKR